MLSEIGQAQKDILKNSKKQSEVVVTRGRQIWGLVKTLVKLPKFQL
jgi:hypothetical protein